MPIFKSNCLIVLAICAASMAHAAEELRSKPPSPSKTLPAVSDDRSVILCPGCEKPFDTVTHKSLLNKLLASRYTTELRKALYWQDILHQFESKAHFDNCDFDSSMRYITELLAEADKYVKAAMRAKKVNETTAFENAIAQAFFTLGQAIHGVQDFYAHSNYVELMAPRAKKVTDIKLVPVWRPEGYARVLALRRAGLISGFVFWGLPQHCPSGTPSHGELAKDSVDTKAGAARIAHLRNYSRFTIAKFLARESSLKFMEDAFERWPLLKQVNGPHVLLDVLVDRRKLR